MRMRLPTSISPLKRAEEQTPTSTPTPEGVGYKQARPQGGLKSKNSSAIVHAALRLPACFNGLSRFQATPSRGEPNCRTLTCFCLALAFAFAFAFQPASAGSLALRPRLQAWYAAARFHSPGLCISARFNGLPPPCLQAFSALCSPIFRSSTDTMPSIPRLARARPPTCAP